MIIFNTKAVGWDTGILFSLSSFIEKILLPTSSKISPTYVKFSFTGLFLQKMTEIIVNDFQRN